MKRASRGNAIPLCFEALVLRFRLVDLNGVALCQRRGLPIAVTATSLLVLARGPRPQDVHRTPREGTETTLTKPATSTARKRSRPNGNRGSA